MTTKSVIHLSTECYPAAKAGGMADVVGSLPAYLPAHGWQSSVVIPKYKRAWFDDNAMDEIFSGEFDMEGRHVSFTVFKLSGGIMPYDLYAIELPGLFDRESIYLNEHGHGFFDEPERNVSFQRSVLDWLANGKNKFDLIHCHDHQVGFVPFLCKYAPCYESLRDIPCFYTIHNGAYNSRYPWSRLDLLPAFPKEYISLIDWDYALDSLCAALRFADHVSAVSPTYLEELKSLGGPLAFFADAEPARFSGILNGIDDVVWDPKEDAYLSHRYSRSWQQFKARNKEDILENLFRAKDVPLISFIGRFAHQKGADIIVPAAERILARFGFVNFYILGSGDRHLEYLAQNLRDRYPERVACYIGYNEGLAHKVYAASDFILMPSRFEPCGLNQMFAMRYGALPIARKTGGLADTVVDYEAEGMGVSFSHTSVDDLVLAITRALQLYRDTARFRKIRSRAAKEDFSWSHSAKIYVEKYNELIEKI